MRPAEHNRLFTKILVAYDGSRESEHALELARDFARTMSAKLIVLGLENLPSMEGAEALRSAVVEARNRYEEKFYRIRLAGMNEGLQVDTAIGIADPCSYVVRKAQQTRAALIVLGFCGDKQARSACEHIVASAPCPVMVVKRQN
jgi:nucleotide-binding universal stress UspA family protein